MLDLKMKVDFRGAFRGLGKTGRSAGKRIRRAIGPKPLIYSAIDLRRAAQRLIKVRRGEKAAARAGQPRPASAPGTPPLTTGKIERIRYIGPTVFITKSPGRRVPIVRSGQFISARNAIHVARAIRRRAARRSVVRVRRKIARAKRRGETEPGRLVKVQMEGRMLQRAVLWNVDERKMTAWIGPSFKQIGQLGKLHEKGGRGPAFRPAGRRYPKRPFMKPALKSPRFLKEFVSRFKNSLKPITTAT